MESVVIPAEREIAVRIALELRAGRSLTDAEWARARSKLAEFVNILRAWEGKTTTSNGGNVVLCQLEH
jgi:hypothetical protein